MRSLTADEQAHWPDPGQPLPPPPGRGIKPAASEQSLEEWLLAVIQARGEGAAFAVSAASLAGKASCFFNRPIPEAQIRQAVQNLRWANQPVCSGQFGYFWPSGLRDILETVEQVFRNPARSELRTARAMRESGRRLFGRQLPLL
jgi:hypothetical protein